MESIKDTKEYKEITTLVMNSLKRNKAQLEDKRNWYVWLWGNFWGGTIIEVAENHPDETSFVDWFPLECIHISKELMLFRVENKDKLIWRIN